MRISKFLIGKEYEFVDLDSSWNQDSSLLLSNSDSQKQNRFGTKYEFLNLEYFLFILYNTKAELWSG